MEANIPAWWWQILWPNQENASINSTQPGGVSSIGSTPGNELSDSQYREPSSSPIEC